LGCLDRLYQKEKLMTKRLKVLGLLVVALCTFGAMAASGASAAEMKNPEFTVATGGTSTSGAGVLFGPAEIKCRSDQDRTTATNKKEGTISIDFLECTSLGEECHSLGDRAGTILTGGRTLLVLLDIGGRDVRGVLITIERLHIECKFLSVLAVVTGSVIGIIEDEGTSKTKFIIKVKARSASTQEVKEYLNEKEEILTAGLLTATNEGTARESGEEAGEDRLTTERETALIN
jgi:hypothetical protein